MMNVRVEIAIVTENGVISTSLHDPRDGLSGQPQGLPMTPNVGDSLSCFVRTPDGEICHITGPVVERSMVYELRVPFRPWLLILYVRSTLHPR